MRWLFVVVLIGCGPPPHRGVAVAPTPVLEDVDRGVAFDGGGAIVCGATRTEVPLALPIIDVSEQSVVAASADGIVEVAHDGRDMLHTWAALHRQLEGMLANDAQLDANVTFDVDTLVIDYATQHGACLRFAYRHSDRCTISAIERSGFAGPRSNAKRCGEAIERAAAPVGAVEAVTRTSPTPDALHDCLAHRRAC